MLRTPIGREGECQLFFRHKKFFQTPKEILFVIRATCVSFRPIRAKVLLAFLRVNALMGRFVPRRLTAFTPNSNIGLPTTICFLELLLNLANCCCTFRIIKKTNASLFTTFQQQTIILQSIHKMKGISSSLFIAALFTSTRRPCDQLTYGFSISSQSRFHGERLQISNHGDSYSRSSSPASAEITMRKQRASNRRTTRRQRGGDELTQETIRERLSQREVTITSSPMTKKGDWKLKRQGDVMDPRTKTGGRGRSKKRSLLYNSLSLYHNKFLNYLTAEYNAEVGALVVLRGYLTFSIFH